jgi:hypothetical protein
MTAMHEFVVPKSMPKTFAIKLCGYTASLPFKAMRIPQFREVNKTIANKGKINIPRILGVLKKCAKSAIVAQ